MEFLLNRNFKTLSLETVVKIGLDLFEELVASFSVDRGINRELSEFLYR